MPVPEAPMDEHRYAITREQEIRFAREVLSMQAEAETSLVYRPADIHLAGRVFALDCRHSAATNFRRYRVSNNSSPL